MMNTVDNRYCEYCDPVYFVIYGICDNCKRIGNPPLFDPHGSYTHETYLKMCDEWNKNKGDSEINILNDYFYI